MKGHDPAFIGEEEWASWEAEARALPPVTMTQDQVLLAFAEEGRAIDEWEARNVIVIPAKQRSPKPAFRRPLPPRNRREKRAARTLARMP